MDKLFGIPTPTLMVALLILLGVCLLTVVWVAVRRPVVFKMGMRNIPRRKAQTILIVIGLMLSTLIISAAITTGDTLDNSVSAEVYDLLGHTDELVVYSQTTKDANAANALTQKIPASSLDTVKSALAGNPNVDGIAPFLYEMVPVMNQRTGLGEPQTVIAGANPADVETFGGLKTSKGDAIDFASLQPGEVVISSLMADKLDAKVGDELTIAYQNQPVTLKVVAIAQDSVLSGVLEPNMPGMVMHLDTIQQATKQADVYSLIAISNAGGVRGSEKLTDDVTAALAPALDGKGLGVSEIKKSNVDNAETFANIFTSVFLVMGLFSIAAGIMLIVLIFTMLAAERRAEMGMARAVGAQRRQLIQQFIAEGTGYALIAGIVGSIFGVLAALGIAFGMGKLFGDFIDIRPKVLPRSLIIAYCLGVVITFIAVVVGSWRISRLNIVAAIRDIPEVSRDRRRKRVLVWGALLLIAGTLMSLSGYSNHKGFLFTTGMSLWPFGILLITRFLGVPSRIISTLVGVYLLVFWLLPDSVSRKLFGKMDGGIEMFFVSGIFLVLGATIVIIQNTDLLLAGISRVGGLFKSRLPAVRTAVAYPGSARGRTGMTIAMFSLIIFSLVMMATISENFTALFLGDDAAAGWNVRADAGMTNPISDFKGTLQAKGVDVSGITAIGQVTTPAGGGSVRLPGQTEWKMWQVHGMDEAFLDTAQLKFQQRAQGYDSDQAVIDALKSGQPVAVVDAGVIPTSGSLGGDPNAFKLEGLSADDKSFAPRQVEFFDQASGQPKTLTIIGIIDSKIGSMVGFYGNQTVIEQTVGSAGFPSYFIKLADPAQSEQVAKEIESKLLTNGVQATSIQKELKDSQRQSTSFLYLIEGFMGLGLIVGVAAIGVIAFRSVVERRQQIGVLRALGFQRSLVSLSFLIETGFVVGMGVISGTVMGLLLARNLFSSEDFAGTSTNGFIVPWTLLIVILVLTIVAALLMTWIPARQAAKIAPAEALRYE